MVASLSMKQALKAELLQRLGADLELLVRAQADAAEGATHDEAKPEDDKDTRALEQSYLARGQARRVEELAQGVAETEAMVVRVFKAGQAVALGALVTVEEGDMARVFFLAPAGGGTELSGGSVQVVTPKSPLGRALLGKREGDDTDLQTSGAARELVLVRVE